MTSAALPLLAAMLLLLAGCAYNGDTLPNAKPDLHKAARLNTQLGIDYMRQGDNQRALTKLKRALSEEPGMAQAHAAIGYLYSQMGQPRNAEREFKKALELKNDPQAHNLYGVFLCGQNDYSRAFHQFHAAASDANNDSPEVALTNAGVCARRQSDDARARTFFHKALQNNTRYAPALLQMADLSYRQGKYQQAEGFMQRYQAVASSSAESLYLAYRIENALGHSDVANAYRRKLLSQHPNSDQTAQLLGTQRHEQ